MKTAATMMILFAAQYISCTTVKQTRNSEKTRTQSDKTDDSNTGFVNVFGPPKAVQNYKVECPTGSLPNSSYDYDNKTATISCTNKSGSVLKKIVIDFEGNLIKQE